MPNCQGCGKFVSYDQAVRDGYGNFWHRNCAPPPPKVVVTKLPKQEKPASEGVVVPDWMARSTHKGSKRTRTRWGIKYGLPVLAAIGRR